MVNQSNLRIKGERLKRHWTTEGDLKAAFNIKSIKCLFFFFTMIAVERRPSLSRVFNTMVTIECEISLVLWRVREAAGWSKATLSAFFACLRTKYLLERDILVKAFFVCPNRDVCFG